MRLATWSKVSATIVLGTVSLAFAQTAPNANLDAYLQGWLETGRFMGAVLVAKDGEVVFEGGYGLANVERGIEHAPATRFRLGSLSKQFTAAAVLQLQERGLLSVHNPVADYLPAYPNGERITLHQLLTHTSGIPDYARLPDYPSYMAEPTTLDALVARFEKLPLLFAPGATFQYSNSNYVLLTAIVEAVSEQSYGDYLEEHLFAPLGMKDTGYAGDGVTSDEGASGYIFTGGGYAPASPVHLSQAAGAGGLHSNAHDLSIWLQALATGKVLDPDTLEILFAAAVPAGRTSSGGPAHYGYGWYLSQLSGRKVVSHGGGINGFSSQALIFPDEGVHIIVLSNLDTGPVLDITRGLAAMVFGEAYETPRVRPAVAIDPALPPRYAGRYALGPNMAVTIVAEGGRLYLAGGRLDFELFPASETEFFLKNADVSLTFLMDAAGTVTGLEWSQNGHAARARKLE